MVSKQVPIEGISANDLALLENEVHLLRALSHPYIVSYLAAYQHEGALCIVLEYAGGGTLAAAIREQAERGNIGGGDTSGGDGILWHPASGGGGGSGGGGDCGGVQVAPGFGPSEVRKWVAQVACALQYMHGLHVLHRDLSTKNIFLSQSRYATQGSNPRLAEDPRQVCYSRYAAHTFEPRLGQRRGAGRPGAVQGETQMSCE